MKNKQNVNVLKQQDQAYHFHANTNPVQFAKTGPSLIEKAEGIYIYTDSGAKIIDGMSGGWCTNLGYGNKRICDAAYQAMQQLSYTLTFNGRTNQWAAALSDKMASVTPAQYEHFFFSSTGSDAVETAIKMALYYWNLKEQPTKRIIISRDLAYHGNTLFASHLVGADGYGTDFGFPLTDIVHRVAAPYPYRYGGNKSPEDFALEAAASLEEKIQELGPENIAAFIAEPIQATLGLIVPPAGYWPEIQRICKQYDILLIADEVVTGFGKTGHMFGFQAFDFEPDLFTLAKGFSSGYFPISAVAIGQKVAEVFQNTDQIFMHGFTNCAHPVGSAIALENLRIIEDEQLIPKVKQKTGPYLADRLQEFLEFPCVAEVNTVGLIGALEIDVRQNGQSSMAENIALGAKIGEIAWKNGLNARPIGTTLGMIFPLIITKQQIDDVMDILKQSFREISE